LLCHLALLRVELLMRLLLLLRKLPIVLLQLARRRLAFGVGLERV
jgi:hypothetical protein